MPEIRTDVCSACHPFYTGEQRIVDTAGQVERFMKRLERRQSESARRELEMQVRKEADEAARKARARGGDADAAAAEVYAKYAYAARRPNACLDRIERAESSLCPFLLFSRATLDHFASIAGSSPMHYQPKRWLDRTCVWFDVQRQDRRTAASHAPRRNRTQESAGCSSRSIDNRYGLERVASHNGIAREDAVVVCDAEDILRRLDAGYRGGRD